MQPAELSTFKLRLEAEEARIPWLYLDTTGNPTCGIGHETPALADAQVLPFQPRITQAEWDKLLAMPAGLLARAYMGATLGRLPDAAINALLAADIATRETAMTAAFPGYPGWPATAQLAMMDMDYNLGLGGLEKFTRLAASAKVGDWDAAALQCHRIGISSERNAETAQFFLQAARESPLRDRPFPG